MNPIKRAFSIVSALIMTVNIVAFFGFGVSAQDSSADFATVSETAGNAGTINIGRNNVSLKSSDYYSFTPADGGYYAITGEAIVRTAKKADDNTVKNVSEKNMHSYFNKYGLRASDLFYFEADSLYCVYFSDWFGENDKAEITVEYYGEITDYSYEKTEVNSQNIEAGVFMRNDSEKDYPYLGSVCCFPAEIRFSGGKTLENDSWSGYMKIRDLGTQTLKVFMSNNDGPVFEFEVVYEPEYVESVELPAGFSPYLFVVFSGGPGYYYWNLIYPNRITVNLKNGSKSVVDNAGRTHYFISENEIRHSLRMDYERNEKDRIVFRVYIDGDIYSEKEATCSSSLLIDIIELIKNIKEEITESADRISGGDDTNTVLPDFFSNLTSVFRYFIKHRIYIMKNGYYFNGTIPNMTNWLVTI